MYFLSERVEDLFEELDLSVPLAVHVALSFKVLYLKHGTQGAQVHWIAAFELTYAVRLASKE